MTHQYLPGSRSVLPRSRRSALASAIQACFSGCTAVAAGVLFSTVAMAQSLRIPSNALPSGPATQGLVTGSATLRQPQILSGSFNPYQVSGNSATITQTSSAGILRWGSFDIGAAAQVNIVQPGATAVLLNKIDGGAYLNKTVIEGVLRGNGQVYIYNPNGIIFGASSQVDVNSLVATTLKIDDNRFLAGLTAPNALPIFSADGTVPGSVVVEGVRNADGSLQQAHIRAANGGKILLLGSSVSNSGSLSAPDGQVMAAAATDKIYLAAPDDVRMRGLLVEVGSGGTVTNETLGKILVGKGNASLAGLAVNQNGVISATTSVQANGSIYLRARDGAQKPDNNPLGNAFATRGGQLTLGVGSVTEVLPDLADTTTAAKSSYNPSLIDLAGASVHLKQNASVHAPGGEVTVTAQADPAQRAIDGIQGGAIGSHGVYLESGASIDVAGTTTTELAMESNVLKVELRGSELADVPLQRNSSVLRGRTVYIDRRKGTPLANVQGWLDLVEYTVGEQTASGGKVTFNADQEVVLAEGSGVNVSGGKVSYRAGNVATTQLQSGGLSVDIGSATADRIYTGAYDAVAGPRNFEAAYSEGRSAGSVRFNGASLILRGNLQGSVTPGVRQRDVSASDFPQGGEIIIGSSSRIDSPSLGNFLNFSFLGGIDFGGSSTAAYATPTFGTAWNASNSAHRAFRSTLDLSSTALAAGGFTRINAYTRDDLRDVGDPWGDLAGTVTVRDAVSLKAGGEFRVAAEEQVQLNSDITIPAGTVEAVAATSTLTVGTGVGINVSGLWTNDRSLPAAPRDADGNLTSQVVMQGGTIVLSGRGNGGLGVVIGDDSRFDASAGAWRNSAGKISGGSGGSISITANAQDATNPASAGLVLGDNVDFFAYGISKGGTLKLSGRNVLLGDGQVGDALDLVLGSHFFTQGGFSKYDITAAGNLTVAAGTLIAPRMDNWVVNRDTAAQSSGRMADAFDVDTLSLGDAQGVRGATSLALTAGAKLVDDAGRLWLQQGASIVTDPGATVSLSGGRQLTVDGRVVAPGGTVNLLLTADPADQTLSYRPERSIWVGDTATIDVAGTAARLWANSLGLTQGELLAGGTIRLGRLADSVLAPADGYVVIEQGARLDVSGTSSLMTLSRGRGMQETRSVASGGGTIDIRAREGVLVEGSLSGAGGDATVSGGSLNIVLDREGLAGPTGSPSADRELWVLSEKLNAGTAAEGIVPATLLADEAFDASLEGKGYVLASTLSNGGFDRIGFKSQNRIVFDASAGPMALSARAGVSVDAPVIAGENGSAAHTVSIDAAYVALGNTDWRYQQNLSAATAGDGGSFIVNGGTIDVVGNSILQGFTAAHFNAAQDIRLSGVVAQDLALEAPTSLPVIHATGSLGGFGTLLFTSSQLYPTTMSEFSLTANGTGSRIEFHGQGVSTTPPLSAAGTLAVRADTIVQDGVLRAPFGSITLTAADTLDFSGRSLTSVAGSGSVPLGRLSNGRDWLYDFGNGHTVTLGSETASNGVALPEKKITSTAPRVNVSAGATIDLSGGGDLYAYEFTAGPGGSRDVLAKAAGTTTATTFAVLPGYGATVAPIDFQYQQDGGLQTGDRVYLSGIPGLAAGFYTLLPAHYALLPGAYAVTASSGNADMAAASNYVRTDGSWVVAGYRGSSVANASRWSGFLVTSGAQVRTQSAYTEYSANTFFAGTSIPLPKDGGHIAFATSQSLTLDGLIRLGAVAGGTRGMADISAPEIHVVSDASQTSASGLTLLAGDLVELAADSLLLGGTREHRSDGTHVAVGANSVTLSNDASHPLTGAEVILAAKDAVTVAGNAAIRGAGVPGNQSDTLYIDGSGASANGALLRVSGGEQVAIVRDAPTGAAGTLSVAASASVSAVGSMNLDATKTLDNRTTLDVAPGAALGLGANRISLGDGVPGGVDGLKFDSATLASLSRLTGLSLTSYTTFDTYGSVTLGSSATKSLSLRGAGMQGYGGLSDRVSLVAETVRIDGGGTYALATTPSGTVGSLAVSAKDIEIGSGTFSVNGFRDTTLTAQREVRAVGSAGVLSADSTVTANAGRFTAASGKDAKLVATGAMTLGSVATPLSPVTTDALGGQLTFSGNTVTSDAQIVARSGKIELAGANGVHVTGGRIDASGYTKAFGSTVAYASGGTVTFTSSAGDVTADAGSSIDVSAVGADAGRLVTTAGGGGGQVTLNGSLKGDSSVGVDGKSHAQGQFVMDADRTTQFGVLNQRLNSAGFTESRDMRVRHGDVTLAAGERIQAHEVKIAADNGNVTVGGEIDADGAKGGTIQLYASQATAGGGSGNVTLLGTALLTARATEVATTAAGSAGDGGRVVLGTATADGTMVSATSGDSSINLLSGARIDVSGMGAGMGGTVELRAPRVGSNAGNDVAVGVLAATLTGSRETSIEAFKTYSGNQITAATGTATNLDARTSGRMYTDSATFSGNASAILSRLGVGADVKLRTGIEVNSSGDLLVKVNETATNAQDRGWNLNAWRFNGEPGVLTLRADGNLTVEGSISDGFVKPATRVAMPGWELDSTGASSWSYRLVAGADRAAANPLAVIKSDTVGDFALNFARTNGTNDQPVALIRTGSGRIDVAAGRDVSLGSVTVDIPDPYDSTATISTVLGATIYTAGRQAALDSGFLAPKNQIVNAMYTNGNRVTTTARFAQGGGDIGIDAGRDINGAATRQLVNAWLYRRGKVTTDATGATVFAGPVISDGNTVTTRYEAVLSTGWWTRYDYFNQGVATFGGGNIVVNAGRDVSNLSLNVATSGQLPGTAPGQSPLVERGGGDLVLRAGGDIRGGSYYVQKGSGSLVAGGAVVAGTNTVADDDLGSVSLRPVLALGDGSISVSAVGNVEIETVFNPTLVRQSTYNADSSSALRRQSPLSIFSTYEADSGVTLTSLAGDAVLGNHAQALSTASMPWTADFDTTFLVYPPSLRVTAMTGSISFQNGFSLWPSATGQLELLAAKSVIADFPGRIGGLFVGQNISGTQPIVMIDASPSALSNIYAPLINTNSVNSILNQADDVDGLAFHTAGGLHTGDTQPVRIIALAGDIVGESYFGNQTSSVRDTLVVPKAVEIIAGNDIVNLGFKVQHTNASDISTVTAGRDFVDSTYSDLNPVRHTVAGPGRLDVSAGRDIDLGTSSGIVTRGNLDNPYLLATGAAINLLAGATANYGQFVSRHVVASDLSAADQSALVVYVRGLNGGLPSDLSAADALLIFKALPASQQQGYLNARKTSLNDLFFQKLRVAAGAVPNTSLDLVAFDALIEALYPSATITGGDINVFGSQLKTAQGGSINLFAPGGSVQAGLTEKPAWVKARLRSDSTFESNLGIYTIAGGNIQSLVAEDFLVNQGRVFTLGGGDITLASQRGDIDAGKGAKTAQSTPPPLIRTDERGNTVVDISASISGSGIATLRTSADVPASSVYALAPRGVFDAGDAGVRSTGGVTLVAQTVLNAGNIVAAGAVSGAGTVNTSSLSGAVSTPANPPTAKSDSVTNPGGQDPKSASSLTVELVGYGSGDADGQQNVTQGVQTASPAETKGDAKTEAKTDAKSTSKAVGNTESAPDRKKKKPQ